MQSEEKRNKLEEITTSYWGFEKLNKDLIGEICNAITSTSIPIEALGVIDPEKKMTRGRRITVCPVTPLISKTFAEFYKKKKNHLIESTAYPILALITLLEGQASIMLESRFDDAPRIISKSCATVPLLSGTDLNYIPVEGDSLQQKEERKKEFESTRKDNSKQYREAILSVIDSTHKSKKDAPNDINVFDFQQALFRSKMMHVIFRGGIRACQNVDKFLGSKLLKIMTQWLTRDDDGGITCGSKNKRTDVRFILDLGEAIESKKIRILEWDSASDSDCDSDDSNSIWLIGFISYEFFKFFIKRAKKGDLGKEYSANVNRMCNDNM